MPYGNNVIADWAGPATGSGVSVTYVDNPYGFFVYFSTGYGFTSNPVVGKRYRIVIRAKTNTGVTYLKFYDGVGGSTWITVDLNTTLKTYTFDFTCLHATGTYIGAQSYGSGEITYFDRFEVYELSPWLDVSGYNNHGDMVNAPTFSAESGAGGTKSFDFDGTSDYVDCGDMGTIGSTFTFLVWFKTASSATYRMFMNIDGNTTGNPQIRIHSGKVQMRGYSSTNTLATSTNYNDDEWHHAAGGINGGGDYFLYIDGVAITQAGAVTATSASWTGNTRLGRYDYSGGYYFDGKLALGHIYNRALTATEIQQNYRTHKGRFGK
jgi:hypothetical protein